MELDSDITLVIITLAVIATIASFVLWRVYARQKIAKAPCSDDKLEANSLIAPTLLDRFNTLLDKIDYLRTRREWRYQTPWILMIGEAQAGKSSFLASIPAKHNSQPDSRSQQLKATACEWKILETGVFIDPEGKFCTAKADTEEQKTWLKILQELDDLRPERPIDGLVITLSAKTLLSGTVEQRREIANNINQQLAQIQDQFEFQFPVYVNVSQVDKILGFGAFWATQASYQLNQMFGWSAPANTMSQSPKEWVSTAFCNVLSRLNFLQIDAAAAHAHIHDADNFFLFPRHFQVLEAPLAETLELIFKASPWRDGCNFRGLYFTGNVKAGGDQKSGVCEEVNFIEDLSCNKILKEIHLARPTKQGIWSRNALIRNIQKLGIATFASMMILLAIASVQLNRQVGVLVTSINLLQEIKTTPETGEVCTSKVQVNELLEQVAQINTNSYYFAIPISWFDRHTAKRSAKTLAESSLQRVVMPAMSCQLELKARALNMQKAVVIDKDALISESFSATKKGLYDYIDEVDALEANIARYRYLISDQTINQVARTFKEFSAFYEYVYETPLPESIQADRGALRVALSEVVLKDNLQLPTGMRPRFITQIEQNTQKLRQQFALEVDAGTSLLNALNAEQEPILDNTRHFTWWLNWVQTSWLGSTVKNNPCDDIRQQLSEKTHPLVLKHQYPQSLRHVTQSFDTETCYRPSMNTLMAMKLAPYNLLFTEQKAGLQMNPDLLPEITGLTDLATQTYMKRNNTRAFACAPVIHRWQDNEVALALSYANEYQKFADKHTIKANQISANNITPLYTRLARTQLQAAMNDAMREAQTELGSEGSGRTAVQLAASSLADQELANRSKEFKAIVPNVSAVIERYQQLSFKSTTEVNECVRRFATDQLGQINSLSYLSRLYEPALSTQSGKMYVFGSEANTKDYLKRQLDRTKILTDYAQPFVDILQKTSATNDAQLPTEQTAAYWNNTINEVNRYQQFHETNGQVAILENLFLSQLMSLSLDNCKQNLAAKPEEYSHEFFSIRRKQIDEDSRQACDQQKGLLAMQNYRTWSSRFNRELADHFPFADSSAPDVALPVVKAFFEDYEQQRVALRLSVQNLKGTHWNAVRSFLTDLDQASAFFTASLGNGNSKPSLQIIAQFKALPARSIKAEETVNWALSSGLSNSSFPNFEKTLDWPFGQSVGLHITWASGSKWLPYSSAQAPSVQVDRQIASIVKSGDWALLHLIEDFRYRDPALVDKQTAKILLELRIPIVLRDRASAPSTTDTAQMYLGLSLMAQDPVTHAPVNLYYPAPFPRVAPL